MSLVWLGNTLQSQGKHAEAVALLREELDRARTADGEGWASANSGVGVLLHHYAGVLWEQKAFKEARPPAEEAWALYQQHPDWSEDERSNAYRILHAVLTSLNDQSALESLTRDELARLRGKLPADDPKLADALAVVTHALLTQKKFAEAEAPARECLAIREKKLPDAWLTFNSRSQLGGSLLGQKKYAEAEPFLLSGYEGMKQREQSIPAAGRARTPRSSRIASCNSTKRPANRRKPRNGTGGWRSSTTAQTTRHRPRTNLSCVTRSEAIDESGQVSA